MSRPNIKISLLSSIFISFLCVFAMSHNAGAMTSVDVRPVGSGNWCINGSNVSNATVTCHMIQNLNNDIVVVGNNMDIVTQGSYYSDTVLDVELTFYRNSNSTSTHAGVNGIESLSSNWALMSYEYQQLNSNTGVIHLFLKSLTNNNNQHILISGHQSFFYVLQPQDRVVGANVGIYAINNTVADYSSIVNAIQAQPNYTQNLNNINNNLNNVNNGISDVKDAINNQNEEEKQETQDAVDGAQDAADGAQEDTDETGTSLLSVFTSVIGVIINSQETTCTFDSHLPFMTGAGTIDLCMFDPPAVVQTIASLLALALFVPFGLHMYKRFISITRSFQK